MLKAYRDELIKLSLFKDENLLLRRIQMFDKTKEKNNAKSQNFNSVIEKIPSYILDSKQTLPVKDLSYSFLPLIRYITQTTKKIFSDYNFYDVDMISLSIGLQINKYLKNEIIEKCLIDYMLKNESTIQEIVDKSQSKEFIVDFFAEYKSLDEIISKVLYGIFKYLKEFLVNLSEIENKIKDEFNIQQLVFVDIELFKSDFHRGNKFAIFLTLDSHLKLIYKPKTSYNEKVFYDFTNEINQYVDISIFNYKIINEKNFSIVEYVVKKPCNTLQDVKEYYSNLGKYLFLFYILGASDIISDNIIANSSIPTFIDLELLFGRDFKLNEGMIYTSRLSNYFKKSVIKSGILPRWTQTFSRDIDILFGATIAVNNQKINKPIIVNSKNSFTVEDANVFFSVEPNNHLPNISDNFIPIDDYIEDFTNGFSLIYRCFEKDKILLKNIVSKYYPKISDQRFLFRDTLVYSILLEQSYNASQLQLENYLREVIFEHLWSAYDGFYFNEEVINSEFEQLCNGDIPIFYSNIHSNTVFSDNGKVVLENVFNDSTLDNIFFKVDSLSSEDLNFQIDLISGTHGIYFENLKNFYEGKVTEEGS